MGGGKWKKDQEAIYRHAKGLGIIDVPHPWGADLKEGTKDDLTKSQWGSFTDRLNAAKAAATSGGTQGFAVGSTDEQKRRSSDWYRTPEGAAYAASLGKPVGFGVNANFPLEGDGDGGDGGNGGLLENAWSQNPNFPMLVSDYTIPNYSAVTNPWTNEAIGASYMPWTVEGMSNVPADARSYIAPEFPLDHPRYIDNPLGMLELPEDWEDLLDMGEEEEEEDDDDDNDDNEQ